MSPPEQKFHHGDLVRIARDLGSSMSHFTADCDAIVIGSYADKYGGSNRTSYTIHIKDGGETSWYYENQLTLIEADRADLLKQWQDEREATSKQQSDLDWIFANGLQVLQKASGASVGALARCFGMGDLWGRNGEGINYYTNAMLTLRFAAPFLIDGDKAGYLAECEKVKAANL